MKKPAKKGKRERWAISVIFLDGRQEFVRNGVCGGDVTTYPSREKAQEMADFYLCGIEDETESVCPVVYLPAKKGASR